MTTNSHTFRLVILIALTLGIGTACSTSKSLMKDGLEFQSSGMDIDAVNAFKASLSKNMSNSISREGLHTAGQSVMNQHLDEFSRNALMNKPKESVYAFLKAEEFKAEVKKYGVELQVPDHYYTTYVGVEESYLSQRYEAGISKLEGDDFSGSKAIFDEILKIHPGYRDVESLHGTSVLEPKYRLAKREMTDKAYRRAYAHFGEILAASDYKDAYALKAQCLEKGSFVMAIMAFENTSYNPTAGSKVYAYALDAMINLKNPFLRIVDRQNLDQVLNEQNFSLSGVINGETAVEVGNLVGAQAILTGEVIDYRESPGQMVRTQMNGFESYSIKETGADGTVKTSVRYKPVNYNMYTDQNRVYVSFHMKLISLETGEILQSVIIDKEFSDAVQFISYRGDGNKLFPQKEGRADVDKQSVDGLRSLLHSRSELTSIVQLSNQTFAEVGTEISIKVENYLNQ